MNDTMNAWHNVWMCPDDSRTVDRNMDVTLVAFAASFLIIIIGFFYSISYIHTEIGETNLIQCKFLVFLFLKKLL